MTAAMIFCGLAGGALVVWRKDLFTVALGVLFLLGAAYLFWALGRGGLQEGL
jgi:cytochrome c oxidase assembly factor CtaG